ncbi:uncharacterized protein LOC119385681 [Rhipicephalus sanguineus]|uniref:uncharacterized protein LOC119385681 n=1 Tax=Rhipicephalus sanguineus TaxID=34632 RepID=UPI001894121D|nr:uncharacterized protein LOC119385681 [Rhipicephalus sanguineus]
MPSLITSWQSCSVVGRNVQTLNMLNRDIIDYTRQRQARGWLTSLDQAQAFDRVEHKFIFATLLASPLTSLHGIAVVDSVCILGISYRASGATRESWEEEVKALKQQITRALEFNFPYYVRRYLLMGVFTGRRWFLSNSLVMPYQVARKVKSHFIKFFWNSKTPLVKYEQLGLPRERGRWNIPSAVVLADTYALKTTLRVLQSPEAHPARKLATYFLGVQSRLFLQTQPPGPKAINPTPFYRHVIGIYKRIAQLNLDTPLLECRNTELAQELLVNSGCEAKNPGFPWVLLTPSWLPGSIQDVVWRFGWSVLPTADRMYKWHHVRSEQCVHCHKHEDNKHALIACRVAKVFWSLVDKAYHPLGIERQAATLSRMLWEGGALDPTSSKAEWDALLRSPNIQEQILAVQYARERAVRLHLPLPTWE